MVDVRSNCENIENLEENFFKQFDVVCLSRCSKEEIVRVNNICRKLSILFYAGDVYGMNGFTFADLIDHKYAEYVSSLLTL